MDSVRIKLMERLNHIGGIVTLTDSEIDWVLSMEQIMVDIENHQKHLCTQIEEQEEKLEDMYNKVYDLHEELQCLKDTP